MRVPRLFCFPLLFLMAIFPLESANADEPETYIFEAARKGDAAELRRLLSESPSLLDARDSLQCAPLHVAAAAGDVESVRTLIEAGADLSARDNKGATPLHQAAWKKNLPVAELLLERGADIQATDWYGRTPLAWALFSGKNEMVEFLRPRMARPDIFSACRLGERDVVKDWLREDPAILSRVDEAGNTPLHLAVWGWQPKTVRLLVSRGADISARNREGETPLMLAERLYEDEAVAAMRRTLARRQKQAWGWAIAMTAGIAGAQFFASRREKKKSPEPGP